MRMQLHTSSLGASLMLVRGVCVLSIETPRPEKCFGERKRGRKKRRSGESAAPRKPNLPILFSEAAARDHGRRRPRRVRTASDARLHPTSGDCASNNLRELLERPGAHGLPAVYLALYPHCPPPA